MDSNFGVGGLVTTDFDGNDDFARGVAIQRDGKIIAVGISLSLSFTSLDFAITRYDSSGSLDSSFGSGGKVVTSFVIGAEAFAVAIQQDGKIIAAGYTRGFSTGDDFALARYEGASFDSCLQDESNGNLLQINTSTGDYQFINCSGSTVGGTGTLTIRGCTITLQDTRSDRRVLARIDTCMNIATASVRVFSQGMTLTISDRNTTNNTCLCNQ